MQLLDTYLKAVARFLPAAERDDIVRELAENMIFFDARRLIRAT